ncbi:MAG: HEAT repeat domain-containing protein [Fimbriimonadaceae bacterium]|nr:HEAT repeat domain-containing protein [Fimbriimonadaceae bacterium]
MIWRRCLPLLLLALPLAAQDADLALWTKHLTGAETAPARDAAEWQRVATAVATPLAAAMADEDPGKRQGPKNALEQIAHQAARPDAEAQRAGVAAAYASLLGPATNWRARQWLLQLLANCGRDEVVDAVAKLLDDGDARIAEQARLCLENNPSTAASALLRARLAASGTTAQQVAYLNGLGYRVDPAATPVLAKLLAHADDAVVQAAAAALARTADGAAADALQQARGTAQATCRPAVDDALLLAAERIAKKGQRPLAERIFRALYVPAEPPRVRLAALRGLAVTLGEGAIDLVLAALGSPDAETATVAAQLVGDLPGAQVSRAFAAKLGDLQPAAQVVLLGALAQRADPAAAPAVVKLLSSPTAEVQVAAANALAAIGGVEVVPDLGTLARGGATPVAQAARNALARLRGAGVDAAIMKLIRDSQPPLAVALLQAVALRQARDGAAAVLGLLQEKLPPAVAAEAARALAALAGPGDLPAVCRLLVALDATGAEAAADVVRKLLPQVATPAERSAPLQASLAAVAADRRGLLLGLLAQSGDAAALPALRSGLAGDADTQITVLEGLAEWPDAAPAADALKVLQTSTEARVRIAALACYVGLQVAHGRRAGQEAALAACREAQAKAAGDGEKRQVLRQLGTIPSAAAVAQIGGLLDDPALAPMAGETLFFAAGQVGAAFRDDMLPALRKAVEKTADADLKGKLQQYVDLLQGYGERVSCWQVSGPYGVDAGDRFNAAYAPEKPNTPATWTVVPTPQVKGGGLVDFQAMPLRGDNRCGYLRTRVFLAERTEARLELGSDDGAKVWLNGKEVHAKDVPRGHTFGEDKVDVLLEAGWNELLLKIANGGGDWSASLRIAKRDGSALAGLKYELGE